MTDKDKRGPLVDQLARAREDASARAVLAELPPMLPIAAPVERAPEPLRPTRRTPEVHREVRLGIQITTNMRHEPPPPPPPGWATDDRHGWRLWRRGVGRVL